MKHNVRVRCQESVQCGINGCDRKHNQLLHNPSTSTPATNIVEQSYTHQQPKSSTYFRIVPVTIYCHSTAIDTYAFLDEGSSLTLIEEELANQLGVRGEPESLCLKWTADMVRNECNSQKISFYISGTSKSAKRFFLSNARTVSKLSLPKQSIPHNLRKFNHLQNLPFLTYENAVPKILIGMDNCQLELPLKTREGKWEEPVATKTRLGWVIHGQGGNSESSSLSLHHLHLCYSYSNSELHQLVKQFFSVENFGVEVKRNELKSPDESRATDLLHKTTKKRDGFYETGLLWKSDQIRLPPSLEMAKNRFSCLERRMKKDPSLHKELEKQINDYINKGYARRLSKKEIQVTRPRTWYLPLFSVTNHNKPGKVRMVWDAAATVNGVSLNSALLKGPEKVNSLLNILLRFREQRFGICGDIKEMYHQVRIKQEDHDSQRFLWRSNTDDEIGVYVMKVMTFGATCSPCSAQYVKDLNAHEFTDKLPRAVYAIKENHYVDDLLDSVDTEEETIKLALDIKFIHEQAGFEMRNWISNSSKVMKALGETIYQKFRYECRAPNRKSLSMRKT